MRTAKSILRADERRVEVHRLLSVDHSEKHRRPLCQAANFLFEFVPATSQINRQWHANLARLETKRIVRRRNI